MACNVNTKCWKQKNLHRIIVFPWVWHFFYAFSKPTNCLLILDSWFLIVDCTNSRRLFFSCYYLPPKTGVWSHWILDGTDKSNAFVIDYDMIQTNALILGYNKGKSIKFYILVSCAAGFYQVSFVQMKIQIWNFEALINAWFYLKLMRQYKVYNFILYLLHLFIYLFRTCHKYKLANAKHYGRWNSLRCKHFLLLFYAFTISQ